jgi:ADP-heptose:LPS heptosyltransferase
MLDAPRRRVLVIFPGALGDFICFLPVLATLGEDSCVDLLARAEFADLVPPGIKVSSLERYEVRRLFVDGAEHDERVRGFLASYAAVYSWMGSQASEFVRQLESVSPGRTCVFPFRPGGQRIHQRDYYLACLSTPRRDSPLPAIALRGQAIEWCDNFWRHNSLEGKAVLTLSPGSGAAEKNWPVHFYRVVAEWWQCTTRGAVVALTGPVEEERGGFEILSDGCKTARDLSLAQAAALLSRSDVFLGNDSGITHLAAAIGVRTIALFGPSNALEWAPLGPKVTVLSRNVACSPCEDAAMKVCFHRRCLAAFYPTEVIGEMERLPEVATLTRWGAGITV